MTFEFDGKKYENASDHQKEWGKKVISELEIKGNEHILDLGCGDGALTAQLSTFVPHGFVLGIDSSKGMIDVAKPKETKNLKFRLLDINKLEIGEKFDVVFSNACLQWVKDHKKLWRNVLNTLKPSGVIRFNFAAAGNCINLFQAIHQAFELNAFKSDLEDFVWPWYMPSKSEYEKLIQTNELSEIKVWSEDADRSFPNKEKISQWIEQPCIVPFLAHLPDEKKEPFRKYVVDETLKLTKQSDGTYFEIFKRLNVSAKKKNV